MKPGNPETDVIAFTGLQKPRTAVTVTALCPGNNPIVAIFKNKKSTNMATQTCFFLSFSEKISFWKYRQSKYIVSLLE